MERIEYDMEIEAQSIITDMVAKKLRLAIVENITEGNFLTFGYLTADKYEINSDGIDTATIFFTFPDVSKVEIVSFIINDGSPINITSLNGVASLPITTNLQGDIEIIASCATYGSDHLIIRGR